MSSALTSQRYCLRWNNHQSNLLTVFDQLLHDESFVDVTLAVEGRFLRAHKMVLSACSPYFQALFVGHPDKHPIVILKDVPYCDMRSLLDFMYRGEVSVDQDRLTAFLKVAESLRIKGLTDVEEDRCDLPSVTSSLLSTAARTPPSPAPPPPPPHLHRIHPAGHKRAAPPPVAAANPLLGSALTAPKRKRGRPRKLSGSSPGPGAPPSLLPAAPAPAAAAAALPGVAAGLLDAVTAPLGRAPPLHDANDLDAHRLGAGDSIVQGSPEMLEVKMGTLDFQQNSPPPPAPVASSTPAGGRAGSGAGGGGPFGRTEAENGQASPELPRGSSSKELGTRKIKEEPEPTPGPSSQDPGHAFGQSSSEQEQQAFALVSTLDGGTGLGSCVNDDNDSLPEDENELITLSPSSEVDLDDVEECSIKKEIISDVSSEIENNSNQDVIEGKQKLPYNFTDTKDYLLSEEIKEENHGNNIPKMEATDEVEDDGKEETEEMSSQMSSTRSFCMREADNLFRCKVCQKTYTHISNFCRHYLTTHKLRKQVFGCPECGKEFTRRDNMMTHLKGVHRHTAVPL